MIADQQDKIRRKSNRRWLVASMTRLGVWYSIIIGATGMICGCPDQQGRGGICKHVVAVDIQLGRMWDAVTNMLARKTDIDTPPTRCHICKSRKFIKHGKTKLGKQRYLCKNTECGVTFSGMPGFKRRHFEPAVIARAIRLSVRGLSLRDVARTLHEEYNIKVHYSTILRWLEVYSTLMDKFARFIRPRIGHRWHCDEIFFKILGSQRYLIAVVDARTRFILSWDVSRVKEGCKPRPLFSAARDVAGIDPWIFVTDGLNAFPKAAAKIFRRRKGFRMVHIRDIHLQNQFNTNNLYERLNGEFRHRIKTVRGFNRKPNKRTDHKFKEGCPALMRMLVVYHNFFRPHEGLNGKTPAEEAGITIHGEDKWITMICNAAVAT